VTAVLEGWPLAATIIAAVLVVGFVVMVLLMREGRSRKLRVGVFVEREYEDGSKDVPRSEWPTQH
jgi:hypothetical protein